ncbi:hypothetical protein ONZ45_g9941 [Pleurotus djamor]|nr:hypothetical protein ONZ45_g9941 [Pleurotus djamor]
MRVSFSKLERLIAICNDKNEHWYLLHLKLDSGLDSFKTFSKRLMPYVQTFLALKRGKVYAFRQQNGDDCGVYVLEFAKHLLSNKDPIPEDSFTITQGSRWLMQPVTGLY